MSAYPCRASRSRLAAGTTRSSGLAISPAPARSSSGRRPRSRPRNGIGRPASTGCHDSRPDRVRSGQFGSVRITKETPMSIDTSVTFTGIKFENPFLLSSAPPTESENNILRAFEAGWGGVVIKTIGLHPVVNVYGARTKFLRTAAETGEITMKKRPGAALLSSWNWELISDKALDWWVPKIEKIKAAYPDRVLV